MKGKLLYSGKVKSLFETEDALLLWEEFRDDTTAFDGEKHIQPMNKGAVANQFSAWIYEKLHAAGVATHFVKRLSQTASLIKRLRMIPLECVVRNIAAGSLCRRLGIEERLPLNAPLVEFFLKNDALHDPLITEDHAQAFGWATSAELDQMRRISLSINAVLVPLFSSVGLILVDAKYEFGLDASGTVCLGDEISPDSCRIWDGITHESLDKDVFRKDLAPLVPTYIKVAERLGVTLDLVSLQA